MAFDDKRVDRMLNYLTGQGGLVEKRMFGACTKHPSMVRLAPEATEAALCGPHTRIVDLMGCPIKGWILVEPEGIKTSGR